jgi:hypothetical protein
MRPSKKNTLTIKPPFMRTLLPKFPEFISHLTSNVKMLLFFSMILCSSQAFGQLNSFLQSPQGHTIPAAERIKPVYPIENFSNQQFVKLNEIVIDQQEADVPTFSSAAAPMKISLEQVRNGSGSSPVDPGAWVAGNLNGSQAHFAEKWSIPYRLTFTGISLGSHTAIIEWDVMQSGKHALDYITHYFNIDNGPGSHVSTFGHSKEFIDPTIGFSAMGNRNQFDIGVPPGGSGFGDILGTSFTDLPDSLQKMSIWNGSIASLTYGTTADLNLAAASQQLTINFTATSSTVIISWGGHIASIADWGLGNSASAISGSPYHTRLISFDGSGGNQDRSLSADAVIDPPTCNITGPTGSVDCNTTTTFTNNSTIPSGYTYTWTLTNNTSGASIVNASADGSLSNVNPIQVNSGTSACNKGYTVVLTIYKNGTQVGAPCTTAVTVNDVTVPTIGSAGPNATIECTATPSFTAPTASDACSAATVHILGTTSSAGNCAGNYTLTRTWDATDACGNHSATVSQTITVQDTHGPTIGGQGSGTTIECTATPSFTPPTANDACGGATVHVLGTTTSAGSCVGNYVLTRTWDATDACGNHSTTVSQVVTVQDTRGPSIGGQGANATIECTASPSFTAPTANDACSGATVNELGTTTSVGSCAGNYTLTKRWDATDACGNHSATVSQTITVHDTQAPIIGRPGISATIECTGTPSFTAPTASDACSGSTVNELGTTTVPGSCAGNYTVIRTWDATDGCGNHSATISQTVTVRDTQGPTIGTAGANATIECTATPPFSAPTASDACSGATVHLLGTTTVTGSCAGNYTLTRTWDATDACGNHSATRSQTVTVVDRTAPVFTSCPADVAIECSASIDPANTGTAAATDNCETPLVTYHDVSSTVGCQTIITRTWTADDGCGNTSTCVQHIMQRDRTAPTIVCANDGTGNATIHDNCTTDANITKFYTDANGNRTWTAIDESGNIATQSCPLTLAPQRSFTREVSNNAGSSQNSTTTMNGSISTMSNLSPNLESTSDLRVSTYPNPFSDKVKFIVTTKTGGRGDLVVYNVTGQRVKTVYEGYIRSGTQIFEMSLPTGKVANFMYVLKIGDKKVSGKVLQINR